MTVIQVTQQLDSDTLQLPELKPLIGKKVEITIREVSAVPPAKGGWDALLELAGKDLIDLDAIEAYREFDKQHWRVNRP